jgi:outer membrane protein TolC
MIGERVVGRTQGVESLRVVELVPAAPPRVVGPGRREREYRARIATLETQLVSLVGECAARGRELDTSQRLERGCQRLLDRLERQCDDGRAHIARMEQQQKRLILALGAAQREVELARRRLALLESGSPPPRARRPQPRTA